MFANTATYKKIILKRLDYYVQNRVDCGVLRLAQPDVVFAHNADAMIATLRASIWGETVPEVDVTYPVTWWDAAKDRWFPVWSRKWFPVLYRHIKVDKHTIFPSITVPNHEPVVTIAVQDRSYSWDGLDE